jgi:hypothetical protein
MLFVAEFLGIFVMVFSAVMLFGLLICWGIGLFDW